MQVIVIYEVMTEPGALWLQCRTEWTMPGIEGPLQKHSHSTQTCSDEPHVPECIFEYPEDDLEVFKEILFQPAPTCHRHRNRSAIFS